MYKQDLAVNDLLGLMCHKIEPANQFFFFKQNLFKRSFDFKFCREQYEELFCHFPCKFHWFGKSVTSTQS